jgi:hypothetical protein
MTKCPPRPLFPAVAWWVRVLEGKKAKAIRPWSHATTPNVEEASGSLSLAVPIILMHEVVAINR